MQERDPDALVSQIESLKTQLIETRDRLRSLLRQSRDMVCCIRFDTPIPTHLPTDEQAAMMLSARMSDCNERFAHHYGFESPADLIGQPLFRLVGTDEETVLQRASRLVRSGYQVTDVENTEVRVDGSVRYILNSSRGEIHDGYLKRVWAIGRDVTARKLMEAAASETSELCRAAEKLNSAFWVLNWTDFETLYIGPAAEDRWGIEKSVMESDPLAWLSVVHAADRHRVRDAFLTHAPFGHFDETFRIITPSGAIRLVRNQAIPIPADTNGIVRVVGLVEDITESASAQSGMQHLMRLSNEMLFVLHSDGRLKSCSHAMAATVGFANDDLKNREWVSLVHPDDRSAIRRKISQLCSGKPTTGIHCRLLCADGSCVRVEWTAAPADSTGLIHSVARDLTSSDEEAASLKKQNDALAILNRLSPRELEIVHMVADGKPSKVIAHELDLSRRTVEKHRSNLMRKLNVQSVADVVRLTLQSRE